MSHPATTQRREEEEEEEEEEHKRVTYKHIRERINNEHMLTLFQIRYNHLLQLSAHQLHGLFEKHDADIIDCAEYHHARWKRTEQEALSTTVSLIQSETREGLGVTQLMLLTFFLKARFYLGGVVDKELYEKASTLLVVHHHNPDIPKSTTTWSEKLGHFVRFKFLGAMKAAVPEMRYAFTSVFHNIMNTIQNDSMYFEKDEESLALTNLYATFQEDPTSINLGDIDGRENLMFGGLNPYKWAKDRSEYNVAAAYRNFEMGLHHDVMGLLISIQLTIRAVKNIHASNQTTLSAMDRANKFGFIELLNIIHISNHTNRLVSTFQYPNAFLRIPVADPNYSRNMREKETKEKEKTSFVEFLSEKDRKEYDARMLEAQEFEDETSKKSTQLRDNRQYYLTCVVTLSRALPSSTVTRKRQSHEKAWEGPIVIELGLACYLFGPKNKILLAALKSYFSPSSHQQFQTEEEDLESWRLPSEIEREVVQQQQQEEEEEEEGQQQKHRQHSAAKESGEEEEGEEEEEERKGRGKNKQAIVVSDQQNSKQPTTPPPPPQKSSSTSSSSSSSSSSSRNAVSTSSKPPPPPPPYRQRGGGGGGGGKGEVEEEEEQYFPTSQENDTLKSSFSRYGGGGEEEGEEGGGPDDEEERNAIEAGFYQMEDDDDLANL